MVGKFKSIRSSNTYCFIIGADGKDYFCLVKNLKDPADRKYMWQGNECAFDVQKNESGKNDEAVNVIPDPVECPRKEFVKSKKSGKVKIHKNYKNSSQKKVVIGNTGYWGIIKGKELYALNKVPKIYTSKQIAEEVLYFINEEYAENSYKVYPVKINKCGYMLYRVEFDGGMIYQGELEIVT